MKKPALKKEKPKETLPGTIRIKSRDLMPYEKTKESWKRSSGEFPKAALVIRLFKANGRLDALIDEKTPGFLKGHLSPDGMPQGGRVKILPNGKELDKAFSLFAPQLSIHNESSKQHWNVIYKNPGGTYSYLYTLEKKDMFIRKKYRVVVEF